MPKVDFGGVKDPEDKSFDPLPEGTYHCKVYQVKTGTTKDGSSEMWRVQYAVVNGEHQNRRIFDNIVWSEKAYPRLKLIFKRMGFNVSGVLDLSPGDIVDKEVMIEVELSEYEDREGNIKQRNVVPYGGYEAVEETTAGAGEVPDDVPF